MSKIKIEFFKTINCELKFFQFSSEISSTWRLPQQWWFQYFVSFTMRLERREENCVIKGPRIGSGIVGAGIHRPSHAPSQQKSSERREKKNFFLSSSFISLRKRLIFRLVVHQVLIIFVVDFILCNKYITKVNFLNFSCPSLFASIGFRAHNKKKILKKNSIFRSIKFFLRKILGTK